MLSPERERVHLDRIALTHLTFAFPVNSLALSEFVTEVAESISDALQITARLLGVVIGHGSGR